MKLEFPKIDIKTSSNFISKSFGIGDERVILEILRSNMYANPIESCVREIMSNSRDANREAGRAHIPIEIELPDKWNDSIKFIDNGPGITPDRMNNIYTKYGRSTKRSDNKQTGGFGLGAKTPYAVADTFTITSVTQENDGLHKRIYVAYIDDSRYGSISLVNDIKLEEGKTGVTITIPVNKNDCGRFKAAIVKFGHYWKPRPIILNDKGFSWGIDRSVSFEDPNDETWKILSGHAAPLVIIDGIPYDIRKSSLFEVAGARVTAEIKCLFNLNTLLFFNTGEIKVTAPREDLDYSPEVVGIIMDRADKIIEYVRSRASKEIEGAKNLWDAIITWKQKRRFYSTFGIKPKWNGLKVYEGEICNYHVNGVHTQEFVKIRRYYYDSETERPRAFTKKDQKARIPISSRTCLVEDDGDKRNPDLDRVLTKINEGYSYVGVIKFLDYKGDGGKAGRQFMESTFSYSHLGVTKLSAIPKATTKTGGSPTKRRLAKIKKLDSYLGRGGRVYKWDKTTLTAADMESDTVFVILRGKDPESKGEAVSPGDIRRVMRRFGIEVYGLQYKYRKQRQPAWVPFLGYCEKELKKLENTPAIKEYLKYGCTDRADECFNKKIWEELKKAKWAAPNPLQEWVDTSVSLKRNHTTITQYECLCEVVKKQLPSVGRRCEELYDEVGKKFPLVLNIPKHYNIQGDIAELASEYIFYVNSKIKEKDGGDGNEGN